MCVYAYMYMYICVYIHIYTHTTLYIYIYRERERERYSILYSPPSLFVSPLARPTMPCPARREATPDPRGSCLDLYYVIVVVVVVVVVVAIVITSRGVLRGLVMVD